MDDRYASTHYAHEVVRAHCYRTAAGVIGASGLPDPKEMTIGRINYRGLKRNNPHCELCESGDMIPSGKRFYNSAYAPKWPLSQRILNWFKGIPFRVRIHRLERQNPN